MGEIDEIQYRTSNKKIVHSNFNCLFKIIFTTHTVNAVMYDQ